MEKQAPTLQSLQQISPKPQISLQESPLDVVVTCVQHLAKIADTTKVCMYNYYSPCFYHYNYYRCQTLPSLTATSHLMMIAIMYLLFAMKVYQLTKAVSANQN